MYIILQIAPIKSWNALSHSHGIYAQWLLLMTTFTPLVLDCSVVAQSFPTLLHCSGSYSVFFWRGRRNIGEPVSPAALCLHCCSRPNCVLQFAWFCCLTFWHLNIWSLIFSGPGLLYVCLSPDLYQILTDSSLVLLESLPTHTLNILFSLLLHKKKRYISCLRLKIDSLIQSCIHSLI